MGDRWDELEIIEGCTPYKAKFGERSSPCTRLTVWSLRGMKGPRGEFFAAVHLRQSLLHSDRPFPPPPCLTRIPFGLLTGRAAEN